MYNRKLIKATDSKSKYIVFDKTPVLGFSYSVTHSRLLFGLKLWPDSLLQCI